MKTINKLLGFCLVSALAGCGGEADINKLKNTIGMSKEQVESIFGKPQSSVVEGGADHPGGYWLYKATGGVSCKLRFDLPPRVIAADC